MICKERTYIFQAVTPLFERVNLALRQFASTVNESLSCWSEQDAPTWKAAAVQLSSDVRESAVDALTEQKLLGLIDLVQQMAWNFHDLAMHQKQISGSQYYTPENHDGKPLQSI